MGMPDPPYSTPNAFLITVIGAIGNSISTLCGFTDMIPYSKSCSTKFTLNKFKQPT